MKTIAPLLKWERKEQKAEKGRSDAWVEHEVGERYGVGTWEHEQLGEDQNRPEGKESKKENGRGSEGVRERRCVRRTARCRWAYFE